MKIEIRDENLLLILKALRSEYLASKEYYKNYPSEDDRIGINTPKELALMYNDILEQAHREGLYCFLDPVKVDLAS